MQDLPSESELERLPVRAIVAYAARCGRRVHPLFKAFSVHIPTPPTAIDTALTIAEEFGCGRTSPDSGAILAASKKHFYAGCKAVIRASEAFRVNHLTHAAFRATCSAAQAAGAACTAVEAVTLAETRLTVDHGIYEPDSVGVNAQREIQRVVAKAAPAAFCAREAANSAYESNEEANLKVGIGRVIRSDFELLQRLAKAERWTSNALVPPDVFGPMWPNGEPEGWPHSDPAQNADPPAAGIRSVTRL
jgi:hypothetical protein